MAIDDDLYSALDGLLSASYRGVGFSMPDTTTSPGRRVVEYLFPGVDVADYSDFGLAPEEVSVTGLIIGDDYQLQAAALRAAFATPGPATLIHPWLGPMTVTMEQPAQITFSEKELRVVRFTATFKIQAAVGGSIPGGLSGLTSAISGIATAASALAAVVGTVVSATRGKAVTRSTRIVTSTINALAAPVGSARAVPQLKAAIVATSPATPTDFDALVVSAAACLNPDGSTPAVAAAAEAPVIQQPTPTSLMGLGMGIVESLTAASASAPADADRALLLSSAVQFFAATAAQSTYADYVSSQEAMAFRARTTDAADALADSLEAISSPGFLAASSDLRRSTRDLQSALIGDINQVIGRLPPVRTFEARRPLDAWLLAQYIYGDTPSQIEAAYRDIVARNNPRHPAALPAGSVEVLA